MTKDICECCDVCMKLDGEKCGGTGDKYGRCDAMSRCDVGDDGIYGVSEGTCGKLMGHLHFSNEHWVF